MKSISSHSNNICPIIITPSYEKYEDRALMLSKIVHKQSNGIIHFHNRPHNLPSYYSKISTYPLKIGMLYKWISTFSTVRKMLKDHKTRKKVIHDLFAPRGIFLPSNNKTKKVLSLYSDTANYYFGKRYKKDFVNKSFFNKLSTHFLYVKRSIYEYIGIWFADGIIANSPEIIDGIIKFYKIKNKKFSVINTCVDTNFWKITEIERETKLIFFAGRISKRKGLDILLESYSELVKMIPDIQLVIAGKHTEEDDFSWGRDFITNNNLNVKFLGEINREEMRYWYNKSSIFVLPSSQEGSPRVIKEAMSCGCTVVCTDLPGIQSLDPLGEYLNYIPINDVKALVDTIQGLIINKLDKGKSIREYITNNFSPEVIANKNIEFYYQLFE